jgi:hypothetical protein
LTLDAFYETLRRRSCFPANKTRRQSNWLYEGVKINAPEFAARVHACTSLCPRGGPTRRAIPGPQCVPARSCTHPPGRGTCVRSRHPWRRLGRLERHPVPLPDVSCLRHPWRLPAAAAVYSRYPHGSPRGPPGRTQGRMNRSRRPCRRTGTGPVNKTRRHTNCPYEEEKKLTAMRRGAANGPGDDTPVTYPCKQNTMSF